MPVFAGWTTLAALDFPGLGGVDTCYPRGSGSVLRPKCPVRGVPIIAGFPSDRAAPAVVRQHSTARVNDADHLALVSPLEAEPLSGVAESRHVALGTVMRRLAGLLDILLCANRLSQPEPLVSSVRVGVVTR